MSSAVAPASAYVEPTSTVSGVEPSKAITGIVLSTTITVRVAVSLFPEESVTAYVTVYVPRTLVSTGLNVTIEVVKSPSKLSVAVAPASAYVEPT